MGKSNVCFVTFSDFGLDWAIAFPSIIYCRALSKYLTSSLVKWMRKSERKKKIEYIVDVGAHVGSWTMAFSVIFPGAEILAIEPSSYSIPYLKFNTKNVPNKIEILQMAVHNQKATVEIASPTELQKPGNDHIDNLGLIGMYGHSHYYREKVPADTLDNIVKRKVDWLKIDTEGNEIPILEGAQRILKEDRPIAQVETITENQNMALRKVGDIFGLLQNRFKYVPIASIEGDTIFVPSEML